MNRVMVIGCPGSGKSTFSKKLAEITGLKLFHLDMIYHKADRTHITREEFDERLGEIIGMENRIIDGNYQRTLERRIAACDTVFLFDLPTEVCLAGALERVGKVRDDIPWTEETLDPGFESFIKSFREKQLPEIYGLLKKYSDRHTVIFKSREEADRYLNDMRGRI
ncbi:adenylate kinase [uncultured Ruminococcus sp.]|uniref:adenylate kinase n=1 Tax=uncultured Ruminococcus sp. TaxID=165186 RepID=UPI0025F6FFF3|nr:adenylate kinase [uncultured Ruminococcus sp.]